MAHHSPQGMSEELRRALGLGPTGDYPQGRLTPQDEGGLRLAVGTKDDKVVIGFGQPTAWISFDAEQALSLADVIRARAHAIIAAKREASAFRKTVCVDLDGVLSHYEGWKGVTHFGDPRPGAKEFLAELKGFAQVVIFTTRAKADFEDRPEGATPESMAAGVRAWLTLHGLPFDDVYSGQGKPMAAAYLDDRAVGIATNPGPEQFAAALNAIRCML